MDIYSEDIQAKVGIKVSLLKMMKQAFCSLLLKTQSIRY
jgi:hypothetical protein